VAVSNSQTAIAGSLSSYIDGFRIHWMMRHDRFADATRLMLAAPPETMAFQDTDEWWRERRVLARKLLDLVSSRPPI
jgi:hypothetical protein